MQETQRLGFGLWLGKISLRRAQVSHSIFCLRSPMDSEPAGLQPMGLKGSDTIRSDLACMHGGSFWCHTWLILWFEENSQVEEFQRRGFDGFGVESGKMWSKARVAGRPGGAVPLPVSPGEDDKTRNFEYVLSFKYSVKEGRQA